MHAPRPKAMATSRSPSKEHLLPNDDNSVIVPNDNDSSSTSSSTYIVQAPRDQIYRVPPPENDKIVDDHRNKLKPKRKKPASRRFSFCLCLCRLFFLLLILQLLCLLALLIFYFITKPTAPRFNVESMTLVGASSTKPEFDVVVSAENPSGTMEFYYEAGGMVELEHKGRRMAYGEPPTFGIKRDQDTMRMKVTVLSRKNLMPEQLSSTAKNESSTEVELGLLGEFPVKLGIGMYRMRKMDMKVRCGVKVQKRESQLKIVSQSCETKI